MPRIILTGFMGTGKTAVGEALAEKLGYEFVDTDQMIEENSGRKIADLFERDGEASFRSREKEMVKKAMRREKAVIATGGGAVLDPENLSLFKESGVLVALSASPEVIYDRVRGGRGRPLLENKDQLQTIKSLLSHRSPFYRQADLIVETSGRKIDEVVEEIAKFLHGYRQR